MSLVPTQPDDVDALRAAVLRAAASLGGEPKSTPSLERPKQAGHGDYATNAAMLLSGSLKRKPREIAEDLREALLTELGDSVEAVEVAGPGFLNIVLSDRWYADALAGIIAAGEDFGAGQPEVAEKVDVEFVSANPTGPLHVGHTRNAAYGDALARLLERSGHDVTREFYVNDFGSQVVRLGESVLARARGEQVPEGGYVGDYVQEIADAIPDAAGQTAAELAPAAVAQMLAANRVSLERFRVSFDVWFSEKSLHDGALVAHAFDVLAQQGRTFTEEGALWVRTTEFGDDKDRVIERSTGEHTYFASDIAYHQEKRDRGFDRLIDVWGADHHGYVPRMQAAYEALGGTPGTLELLIMQFVSLVKDGEEFRMSKRGGTFVTLDDLLDEIGVDAARWYLLQRSHDTTIELDLNLAASHSQESPVYYVQMAHARVAGIFRNATATPDVGAVPAELHASERALIKALLAYPAELLEATERRAPHRIATYVLELAQTFSAFYRDCPVAGEPEEPFRLALAGATKTVIAGALDLLGVTAPESMTRDER